jgi:hypothetical protein
MRRRRGGDSETDARSGVAAPSPVALDIAEFFETTKQDPAFAGLRLPP